MGGAADGWVEQRTKTQNVTQRSQRYSCADALPLNENFLAVISDRIL